MAQEWLYKATDTIASLHDTDALARIDRFLAKAAYERGNKKARADFVKEVAVGDIIHFYFKHLSDPRSVAYVIGTFEVTDHTINPARFSWPTEQTHLVTVIEPSFEQHLKHLRYEEDPQLGGVTGWALRPTELSTPPYDPDLFPGPRCFVRRP